MSDKEFYKNEILKMVSNICNEESLRSIYSFAKVFADDEGGKDKDE